MSIHHPLVMLLMNLEGHFEANSPMYMSKEAARAALVMYTGKDFGFEANQWRDWLVKEGCLTNVQLHLERM